MQNPFSTIINKLWGKVVVPELNIDEYHNYTDIRLQQELNSVGNEKIIRDESTSSRTKRRKLVGRKHHEKL